MISAKKKIEQRHDYRRKLKAWEWETDPLGAGIGIHIPYWNWARSSQSK